MRGPLRHLYCGQLRERQKSLAPPKLQTVKNGGAEEGGAGNRQNPGPNNAAGDAPMNGGEAVRGAHTDDGAGNRVRGADGNAEMGRACQRERAGGLRGKPAKRGQFGDALAHGFDDAPAAGHGAAAHRQMAANNDPVRRTVGFHEAAYEERSRNDAHAFLCVVGAVAETVEGGGNKLQAAKPFVYFLRALAADEPTGGHSDGHSNKQAEEGSEKDEYDRLRPAAQDDRAETGFSDSSATIAAHERVRRAGGQTENERDHVPGDGAEQAGEEDVLVDQIRSEEHTSELQSLAYLVCRLLL